MKKSRKEFALSMMDRRIENVCIFAQAIKDVAESTENNRDDICWHLYEFTKCVNSLVNGADEAYDLNFQEWFDEKFSDKDDLVN